MDRKFKRTGSVGDALHRGCPRDARTKENVFAVAQAVALQLGLSRLVLHNKNLVIQKSSTFFFECKFG